MTRSERRTSRATSVAFAVALAILGAAPSARADDEVDARSLQVEKLADDAFGCFTRGEYAPSVALYLRAHEAAPSAVLAFDIAWLYDKHLASPALAVDWYKRALASVDATPQLRARAEERLAALGPAERAAAPVAKATPVPSRGERNDSPAPLRTWAALAGGTGLVALGIGVGFAVVAKNKDADAARYCDGDRCTDARALTLTDEARSAATIADVAVITGAVFLAGGLTLWLLAPRRSAIDVGVRASPGGGAGVLAPSFVIGGRLP